MSGDDDMEKFDDNEPDEDELDFVEKCKDIEGKINDWYSLIIDNENKLIDQENKLLYLNNYYEMITKNLDHVDSTLNKLEKLIELHENERNGQKSINKEELFDKIDELTSIIKNLDDESKNVIGSSNDDVYKIAYMYCYIISKFQERSRT